MVAWADARPSSTRRCCCLPAPWRRLCLQVNENKVYVGGQMLYLTPSSEATPVTLEAALRPEPHAWTLCVPKPPRLQRPLLRLCVLPNVWLLAADSEAERELWLRQIEDGIQLSHGTDSPHYHWRFGAELGKGTFGVCRTAEHRRSQVRCACKMVSRSFVAHHAPAKEALEREVRLMRRLDGVLAHSPTLRLLEVAQYGDLMYLFVAPECVGDLLQLLDAGGPFTEAQAAAVAAVTLRALHALHATGICHLDVKPQNIMWRHATMAVGGAPAGCGGSCGFTANGAAAELYLGDFGCARELPTPQLVRMGGAAAEEESLLARGGWPCGTRSSRTEPGALRPRGSPKRPPPRAFRAGLCRSRACGAFHFCHACVRLRAGRYATTAAAPSTSRRRRPSRRR